MSSAAAGTVAPMARARSAPAASPPPAPVAPRRPPRRARPVRRRPRRPPGPRLRHPRRRPGVGKTRLADQCLALADQHGRNVARATATEGSAVGAARRAGPPAAAGHRRRAVRPGGGGGRAAPGAPRTRRRQARWSCSSTTSTCSTPPRPRSCPSSSMPTSSSWWPPCDRTSPAAGGRRGAVAPGPGAAGRPGGPGPGRGRHAARTWCCADRSRRASVAEIWTASQGNVLLVRELVLGALDRGHLVEQRGVWRLVGPLVTTPRLRELIAARLGRLPPATVAALDMLAVWEPAGLATLEAIVGAAQLELLDRHGLLTVRTDGRRQEVRLAHPLYGEILRDRMPGPDPPPPPAGARRPHRRLRRPPPGGRHPGRHRPARRRPARPTPPCWSGPPAWPATARTSRRSSGWPGPRWPTASRRRPGCCWARRSTSWAGSPRPRTSSTPRTRRAPTPTTRRCSSTSPRSAPGT